MRCGKNVFLFALLAELCLFSLTTTSSSVSTLINAKWKQTPLYLEVAEYLSDENKELFWSFVKSLSELGKPLGEYGTDSQQYLTALNLAKLQLVASRMPLLKLTVSMHSLTPRIQAHLQSANESIKDNSCQSDAFAVIETEVACTVDDLKIKIDQHLEKSKAYKTVDTFSFDHIYPGSEKNDLTVLLYGDIGTRDFLKFHNFLVKEVTKGRQVRYIFRHYLRSLSTELVRLSAYGVELHLKSTEYKSHDDAPSPTDGGNISEDTTDEFEIHGIDFKLLKSRFPESAHSLEQLKKSLIHSNNEIPQLKAWEFQDLGLKAAATIAEIQSDESLQILQYTSQNFPMHSKTLLNQKVPDALRNEVKHNTQVFGRSLNIVPPDGSLFINGLFFDADGMDLENLLEIIRADMGVLDTLYNNGIHGNLASSLLTVDLSKTVDRDFAIDIRDAAIFWVNDIETDAHYRRWPSSVTDLLRPTFPGMLRNIRKNLFNLVLVFDPLVPKSLNILKLAENFVTHLAPVRLGLVFDITKATPTNMTDYRALLCAFNYVARKNDGRTALNFLTNLLGTAKSNKVMQRSQVEQYFKKKYTTISNHDSIFDEDSEYEYDRDSILEFVNRLGLRNSPQALLNGVPMQQSFLDSDSEFEEAIFTEIMQQTSVFQKAVYRGDLTDNDAVIDYLMNQPHVMPRLNQRILDGDKTPNLDLNGMPRNDLSNLRELAELSNRDLTATLANNLKYFSKSSSKQKKKGGKDLYLLTLWIFADLNTSQGKNLLRNALVYLKSSSNARLAFIPNCEGVDTYSKKNLNKLIWAYSQAETEIKDIDLVLKWLEESSADDIKIPESVNEILDSADLHIKMLRVYAQRVLGLRKSESAVVGNGKIYGPLHDEENFGYDDLYLIEHLSAMQYGDKILKILKQSNEDSSKLNSDTLLKVYGSLLARQPRPRFKLPDDIKADFSVIKLEVKNETAPHFDIVAVIDPASKAAQKLSPILILLRNILNSRMRVFLTPLSQHSDMPVKNFYRYVLEPEVQFDTQGKLNEPKLVAKFTQLPQNVLLTQNMHVPDNWLVEAVRSVFDLDNIKLSETGGPVHSEFELEFLLLEGHCFDSTTGAPPRGLQITLGRNGADAIVDTIVMANLGYFQLKANPGAWQLRLREGKSADLYDITSVEGTNSNHDDQTTKIVISSLRSHVIKLRVSKKTNKQDEDLLDDNEDNGSNSGIWNSIASSFSGSATNAEADETINIFSVASGHLYERLLRIMMVSLLKHTKSPVKFWFLKNYLSPQFTDFLPDMAREYKFQFELVQYKWPRWLHQQTEKQRTIWGYKILFLDVLFPLNVRKIIFVDADAVVRTDINELYEMDLGNAPYAYTPFCDSRKEMDGFRFWKQGYWRSHLAGRRYHISALYVVDLKRFRKIAAGDRLRGQYQALSQDPNSLSNLDQDLPNNMIHQVAIKSLPQEWLWCETWCNDSSLKTAKVIDLCNNPLTKEAKLTAAQRIIPEWKSYDEELKQLMKKIEDIENIEHEHDSEEKTVQSSSKTSNSQAKHNEL